MDVNNVRFGNYSIGNSNARQLKGEQKPAEEKSAETKQNQNVFINPDKAMDVLAAQGMMNMAQIELVSKNEEKPFNPSTFLKDAEEVLGYKVSDYISEDRMVDIEAAMGRNFNSGVDKVADIVGNEVPLSQANRLALAAHIFAEE